MLASRRVLGTAELLERILLNLSFKQLLVVPLVSRAWKENVDKSTNLQTALFLRKQGVAKITLYAGGRPAKTSRLAGRSAQSNSRLKGRPAQDLHLLPGDKSVILNPILPFLLGHSPYRRDKAMVSSSGSSAVKNRHTDHPDSKDVMGRIYQPQALWRRMQVCHPPARNVRFQCDRFSEPVVFRAEKTEGVTLGDIMFAVNEHWSVCNSLCPIGSDTGGWELGSDDDLLMINENILASVLIDTLSQH